MLFGSIGVYRSKKIWVDKNLCVHLVCGHALFSDRGKISTADGLYFHTHSMGKWGVKTHVFGPKESIGDV